eukprot:scaffold26866_cov85-Phaeocystis_antarctica.AAC.2
MTGRQTRAVRPSHDGDDTRRDQARTVHTTRATAGREGLRNVRERECASVRERAARTEYATGRRQGGWAHRPEAVHMQGGARGTRPPVGECSGWESVPREGGRGRHTGSHGQRDDISNRGQGRWTQRGSARERGHERPSQRGHR